MPGALLNIDVPDLKAAEAFYTAAWGLSIGRRFDGWTEVVGLPVPIYLLPKPAGAPPAPGAARRDYARHWTPVHVDILVDDLDVATARALAAGAVIEQVERAEPYGRITIFADPFGHGFCLIEMNEEGYDALV